MENKKELELMRHNCTPSQFAAYVRHQLKKHNLNDIWEIDYEYWKRGGDIEFDYSNDATKPAAAERSISKPYEMQTYFRGWNGAVFNVIMEFDFFDEKTGTGYFYILDQEPDQEQEQEQEPEPLTMRESINDIISDYLSADATEKEAKKRKEEAKEKILNHVGTADGFNTDVYSVVVKKTDSCRINTKELIKDFPDIKKEYGYISTSVSLAIADTTKAARKTA